MPRLPIILAIALIAACGSSSPLPTADGATADSPGSAAHDVPVNAADLPVDDGGDAPTATADSPASSSDGPLSGSDGPSAPLDAPPSVADGPTAVDGPPERDAYFISIPDGRKLQVVDYCPPIHPLVPDQDGMASRRCTPTYAEAVAAALAYHDAGYPFSYPYLARCSEGYLMYVPLTGMGKVCYYDGDSGNLIAYSQSDDVTHVCPNSDLASFVYAVYGALPTCTNPVPAVDGGG